LTGGFEVAQQSDGKGWDARMPEETMIMEQVGIHFLPSLTTCGAALYSKVILQKAVICQVLRNSPLSFYTIIEYEIVGDVHK
jgi:hypothetical protein